jgi:hypothetical protein
MVSVFLGFPAIPLSILLKSLVKVYYGWMLVMRAFEICVWRVPVNFLTPGIKRDGTKTEKPLFLPKCEVISFLDFEFEQSPHIRRRHTQSTHRLILGPIPQLFHRLQCLHAYPPPVIQIHFRYISDEDVYSPVRAMCDSGHTGVSYRALFKNREWFLDFRYFVCLTIGLIDNAFTSSPSSSCSSKMSSGKVGWIRRRHSLPLLHCCTATFNQNGGNSTSKRQSFPTARV